MKKSIILLGALLLSSVAFSQVGINTTTPTATLDVVAKNATGTSTNTEGLIIPRIDRQRAQSMTGIPTSTLIYVNDISTGAATGTAINITSTGFYYYNGTVWAILGNVSNGGDTTNDAWINNSANAAINLGTKSDGSSVRPSGTEVTVTDVGNVGIGTLAPNASASLQLEANNKALLINRVGLISNTDIVTVPNPATGMLVYHTDSNTLSGTGFYYWNGSKWLKMNNEASDTNFQIGEERAYTYIFSAGAQGTTGPGGGSSSRVTVPQMTGRYITNTGTISNVNVMSSWLGVFGNTQTIADLPIVEGLRIDGLLAGNAFKPRFFNTTSSNIKYSVTALSTSDSNINGTNMTILPNYYSHQLDGDDVMSCQQDAGELDLLELLFDNGKYYRITYTSYRTEFAGAADTDTVTCSGAGACSNVTNKTVIGILVRRVR